MPSDREYVGDASQTRTSPQIIAASHLTGNAFIYSYSFESVSWIDRLTFTYEFPTVYPFISFSTIEEDQNLPVELVIYSVPETLWSLPVSFSIAGDATIGVDYYFDPALTSGLNHIILPAQSTFSLHPLTDSDTEEGVESIVVTIEEGEFYDRSGEPEAISNMIEASGSGDPHFVGFYGQIFDYIGKPLSFYNILSDKDFQVNVFLGRQQTGERSFIPGPVMKKMAVLTSQHTILLDCGGTSMKDSAVVTFDRRVVKDGQKRSSDGLSVSFQTIKEKKRSKDFGLQGDDNIVAISRIQYQHFYSLDIFFVDNVGDPRYPDRPPKVDPSSPLSFHRRFIDFKASLLDPSRDPHGILGQTAHFRSPHKFRSLDDWKIEGKEEDYQLKDGLTGFQFAFNRFTV